MQFLPDYRVNFVWRRSKSEAWLKFGRVARNFAPYKKLLMRSFLKNRKKSRLKNQDTERTWTSNPLLESIVIPALCDLIWFDISFFNLFCQRLYVRFWFLLFFQLGHFGIRMWSKSVTKILIDCLIGGMIDWLINRLDIDWSICWLIDWLVDLGVGVARLLPDGRLRIDYEDASSLGIYLNILEVLFLLLNLVLIVKL